jgi:tetratricopeptide (TPR) repeat protein
VPSSALSALIGCALLFPVSRGTTAHGPLPTPAEIDALVGQLGEPDFVRRQAASERLTAAGRAAEPALRAALGNRDAEVVRRAVAILDRFAYGLYPDTPPAVATLIEEFRSGEPEARAPALRGLAEYGPAGYAVLRRLPATEPDGEVREGLAKEIGQQILAVAPKLVAAGRFNEAEALLEAGLAVCPEDVANAHAVFWHLRGRMDVRVRRIEERLREAPGPENAEALIALLRIQGDLTGARRVAEQHKRDRRLEAILVDLGEWRELARRLAAGRDGEGRPESLALEAAYLGLANDRAARDRILTSLRERGGLEEPWPAARALLLNDRPADALALLVKAPDVGPACELLTAQNRFHEALDLASRANVAENEDPGRVDLIRARILHLRGDRKRADRLFAAVTARIDDEFAPLPFNVVQTLVEIETRLGRRARAAEHAARALAVTGQDGNSPAILNALFPEQEALAAEWWKFLSQTNAPDQEPGAMRRLQAVLTRRMSEADLMPLMHEMAGQARPQDADAREAQLLAVAAAGHLAGAEAAAEGFLREAAANAVSPLPAQRLGDLLAERGKWNEAATWYATARGMDDTEPLNWFLNGQALIKAGRAAEGGLLIERAHLLPLGSDDVRLSLAAEYLRRGFPEAARRECLLVSRLADPFGANAQGAWRLLAEDAARRRDFQRAAACAERARLSLHQAEPDGTEPAASYLAMASLLHGYRALARFAEKKTDEARIELATALKDCAADVEAAILVVPELDRKGLQREADEFFHQVWSAHNKLAEEYPDSGWTHNNQAWLAARCRRSLDSALSHARKATELEPDNAAFLDTLAEVHFQRRDRPAALSCMRKCLEREPESGYYRKQLSRFERDDPSTEPDPNR